MTQQAGLTDYQKEGKAAYGQVLTDKNVISIRLILFLSAINIVCPTISAKAKLYKLFIYTPSSKKILPGT